MKSTCNTPVVLKLGEGNQMEKMHLKVKNDMFNMRVILTRILMALSKIFKKTLNPQNVNFVEVTKDFSILQLVKVLLQEKAPLRTCHHLKARKEMIHQRWKKLTDCFTAVSSEYLTSSCLFRIQRSVILVFISKFV